MAINLQTIINSRISFRLVSRVGRAIPPSIGFRFADRVAELFATRKRSGLIRAIRANQWVIRGACDDLEGLDQAVVDALKSIARSLYSLHHYVHNPAAVLDLVTLGPVARELFEGPEFKERGLILVGLHLSSFDLFLQAVSMQGFKALVLTIPDSRNGRHLEYEMRKKTGRSFLWLASLGLLVN